MTSLDLTAVVSSGPLLAAIAISALAGLLSFLSPCCLPLVPGYLAYITGAAGSDITPQGLTRRYRHTAVTGTALFVLGFAAVFTSYGALFGAVGWSLLTHQTLLTRVLGALTIVLGLVFAGALSAVPGLSRTFRPAYRPRVGVLGAPLLGVMFGIGWTPCIGPTLAAVLTLATTTGTAGRGAILTFAYSLGLGIPFLLAAFGISRLVAVFAFARRHAVLVMRSGGGMLVALGFLEVLGLWSQWLAHLQDLDQRLAGTALNGKLRTAHLIPARYPFLTAWTVVGVIVAGLLVLDRPWQATRQAAPIETSSPSNPYSVAAPISRPPSDRVRGADRALGIIERACGQPGASVAAATLHRPLRELRAFVRQYPNGHFEMGGESGTSVALLLVTRFLLRNCNPAKARGVTRLITELTQQ